MEGHATRAHPAKAGAAKPIGATARANAPAKPAGLPNGPHWRASMAQVSRGLRRSVAGRRSVWATLLLSATLWACQDVNAPTGIKHPDTAPARRDASPGNSKRIPGQYIVVFADSVDDVPGLAKQLAAQSKGELRHTYTAVLKGFAANLPDEALAGLEHNPRVSYVESNAVVTTDGTMEPLAEANATWGLDRIDQRPLPLNTSYTYDATGNGVTAYIVDTGIRYTHSEFGGRASFGYDVFYGDGSDCNGHGTHVAGTVGGAQYGVAKGVKLVSVRVLDCNASGAVSGVVAGLDWIAKNRVRPGVANMSIGGGVSSTLDNAVENLFRAGIVTAVAAGNASADACTSSPARAPNAMTVGATDAADGRAGFSNYGSCVDWFAPGVSITSSYSYDDDAIATLSGTSMASPHTAGAAALYLERNPGATPQQVRDGLFNQTTKGVVISAASTNNHLLYTFGDNSTSTPTTPSTPPVANFSVVCNEYTCSFTDQSSSSSSSLSSWAWDFGDGVKATGTTASHTYAAAGTYSVKLTVTDALKLSATTTKSVTISPTSPTNPPKVLLSVKASKVKGGNVVDLSWSGATTANTDVYRNNMKLATVVNTGRFTDNNPGKGSLAGYTYRVCESGSSTACSQPTSP